MIARLIPTALAMSSICASRTPDSSKSRLVAARICCSLARRRAAAADCRLGVRGVAGVEDWAWSALPLMVPMLVQLRFTPRVSRQCPHGLDRVGPLGRLVVAV